MRIFLAGATGVIGRRLVPALIAGGHELTVLARTPGRASSAAALGATVVGGDALVADQVSRAIAAAEPELIIHQLTDLSDRSPAANAQLRIDGTHNLVEGALAAGVSAIVVQSIAWAYAPSAGPADEDTPLDLDAEDPARRTTVDAVARMEASAARIERCVILRNGLFYGPGTWYAPDGAMAAAARDGALPRGADISSLLHIDDAASAALQAISWPTGIYNVADDEPAGADEWVPAFCAAVGAPLPDGAGVSHAWARGATNARARRQGWTPAYPTWRRGFTTGLSAAASSGSDGSSASVA